MKMLLQQLEFIQRAFNELEIQPKTPLHLSSFAYMEESVTNKFIKVAALDGTVYLVRINGQLWPPFSRTSEESNLNNLQFNSIDTTVIYNNKNKGIQICKLRDKKSCFSELNTNYRVLFFIFLAKQLRYIHNTCQFEGNYPVQKTIFSSFNRLPQKSQRFLNRYYGLVMLLIGALCRDTKNHVSSHNDLLPSSIYMKDDLTGLSIVDWEYSAKNHRSYDLAFFLIKARTSAKEERQLLRAYDPSDSLNTHYNVSLMKPVIRFLLMTWASPSSGVIDTDIVSLNIDMQNALFNTSGRRFCVTILKTLRGHAEAILTFLRQQLDFFLKSEHSIGCNP
jgi:thiamine kinase-like enzyme